MRGVDLSMVITRVSLQEHEWIFQFAGCIADADQFAAVQALLDSPKVQTVLGLIGRPAPVATPTPAPAIAAPAPAPTPVPAPAPVPSAPAAEETKPAKGFGKRGRPAASASVQQPAQAAATATVAPTSAGLDSLAAELGNLISGAPAV